MTPEEKAEARRLVDTATPGPHFKNQDGNRLTKSVRALVPQLLDALEAAERERDMYKKAKAENDERFQTERDTARAQVKTLAEALRTYVNPTIADEILKAAGVET